MNLKGLLISFLLIGIVANATAQQPDLNQKMPVDPTVKIGKLSNGLTYYLKQNPKLVFESHHFYLLASSLPHSVHHSPNPNHPLTRETIPYPTDRSIWC